MFHRLPVLLLIALCQPALAATFPVNSDLDVTDPMPDDGICDVDLAMPGLQCTLRAAVMTAENNDESDTIIIPAGMFINLDNAGDGDAELGDLDVTTTIELVGFTGEPPASPADWPLINASGLSDRHFQVLGGGQLTLRGLRLVNGSTPFQGGSVYVSGAGTLTAEHVLFGLNSASNGGAVGAFGPVSLHLFDTHFVRNDVTANGAAISIGTDAEAIVERSSFQDNRGSAGLGATIFVNSSGQVRLDNVTLDGGETLPPIPGLAATVGISINNDANLVIRNATISNYSDVAVRMSNLDSEDRIRLIHSVLEAGTNACFAAGTVAADSDIRILRSKVQNQSGCAPFYETGVSTGLADLSVLTPDGGTRATWSRPPTGALSNIVDKGLAAGQNDGDLELVCLPNDQRGNPRPLDGNGDEVARCDLGAVEEGPPETYIVNHFATDLIDANPGDGFCQTLIVPELGSVCTLRAAVMEANASPGLQMITFEPSASPLILDLPASAGAEGGDLDITEAVIIQGNQTGGRPATYIQNQRAGERLFRINAPDQSIQMRDLILTGGDASTEFGGAVLMIDGLLVLSRAELSENHSGPGGGALALIDGQILVQDSDFHENSSDQGGSAIQGTGGYFSLRRSSVRGHSSLAPGGTPLPALDFLPGSGMSILASTVSGNLLGVRAIEPSFLAITQSTIAGNEAGGLIADLNGSSEMGLYGSIFSNTMSGSADCVITGFEGAAFVGIQYLLSTDGSCDPVNGTELVADPLLLPLHRPAGQISFSHNLSLPPAASSPAIDVAASPGCSEIPDQHGRTRPIDIPGIDNLDGACDLGAVEMIADQIFHDRFQP